MDNERQQLKERPMSNEQENIHPSETPVESLDLKWNYSGKALRGQCILYWLLTLAFLVGGIYFSVTGKLGTWYAPVWIGITALLVLLWFYFSCVYLYRTWTIRYRLTETRLYCEQGLFNKVTDTMELVYIEDVQLQQTLLDRVVNGGVGRLIIFSTADKTSSTLRIGGIENPRFIFEQLDTMRAKVRAKRAVLSN
ncbi:hypothetical protein FACS1894170_01580 [Planctomycetales bacterium]|nr:hypothetical protein FACS1894170_01580 [Planctomycetales bacterium]